MRRRSEELELGKYDTDKVPNNYLHVYDRVFESLFDRKLLELGVRTGGSLRLWRDYFPHGTITGLDVEPQAEEQNDDRLRIYKGRQEDASLLSKIAAEVAPMDSTS